MPTPPLSDELCRISVEAYLAAGRNIAAAAKSVGLNRNTFDSRLRVASKRGFLLSDPAMPGYHVSSVKKTTGKNGSTLSETVTQKLGEPEEKPFEVGEGRVIKKITSHVKDGLVVQEWVRHDVDAESAQARLRAMALGLTDALPRAEPVTAPRGLNEKLLCQYTVTDLHLGLLSWKDESGADYDLKIAEDLILKWFRASIEGSPPAKYAILAQLGDFMHYDSMEAKTPTSGHVLDSDSRFQKIARVAVRVVRKIIAMLLEKHEFVKVVMADANHDPVSATLMREWMSAHYDEEPRIEVDTSATTYYYHEFGNVSLFYHHGHRRNVKDVDSVFAGKFREVYGRTKYSYAHVGHLHSDELKTTNLMKVERHETLAAPSSYEAAGGWISGRSAKVITYHSDYGKVGEEVRTPEMVM